MNHVIGLKCVDCGADSDGEDHEYSCTLCGGPRDVLFDYDAVRAEYRRRPLSGLDHGILRYAPLLPLSSEGPVTPLQMHRTPVYEVPRLAALVGVKHLFLKDDSRLPTGSLKDRASYVATARAAQQGHRTLAAASTGNAATALAGLCASMGLEAKIFVPKSAPEGKVAQLLMFGADVFLIDADYDDTYDLCQRAVERFGWYNRSAATNPYLVEGKKTVGLEIAEQGPVPDWISMSIGDGCSIAGAHKGLKEMHTLGAADRVPRFLGVQAEHAAPIHAAFQAGAKRITPIKSQTLADSINVGTPRNPTKALNALRESHGDSVVVSDEQILEWLSKAAASSGVFGEPAAVTSIVGAYEARRRGIIQGHESVLCVVTGSGLKDPKNALRAVRVPPPLPPTLESVTARVEGARK